MHALEKELATPLRCSCLENPRDRGAWWAAVYGIAQNRTQLKSLSSSSSGKEFTCQCRRCKRHRFNPWVRKIPWSWKWQPTPVFLPGESPGQRSLVGYSSRGRRKSDMTEHAHLLQRVQLRGCGVWVCRLECPHDSICFLQASHSQAGSTCSARLSLCAPRP